MSVERELDRTLTLLRNKIREQGFTQLQVQAELAWGRSYISQLLTKQKSLRVEQVLRILQVIHVDPADFYKELYRFPESEKAVTETYPTGAERVNEFVHSDVAQQEIAGISSEVLLEKLAVSERKLNRSERLLGHVVEMLVERNIITEEERASLKLGEGETEDPAN